MWFHVSLGHDRVLDQLTTVNVEFAEIVTCLGKSGERTRPHVFELSVVRLRAEAHCCASLFQSSIIWSRLERIMSAIIGISKVNLRNALWCARPLPADHQGKRD